MQTVPLTNRQSQKIKKTRTSLENQYLTQERRTLYAPFEGADFIWYWDEDELGALKAMWNHNFTLIEMAEVFKRDPYEVLFMVMDRLECNVIGKRTMGLGIVI